MVATTSPQRTQKPTYHQRQMRQDPNLQEVQLLCLADGTVLTMLDDGPFKPGQAPNIARQRILALVKKRSEPDVNGHSLPLYVAVKPGLKIWDPAIEQMREVPTMTAELRSFHEELLAVREQNAAGGRVLLQMQKAKQDEAQAATRATVIDAMADVFAASKTAPQQRKPGAQ